MKHLLFGALSVAALTACGSVVVVDGDPNREGSGGTIGDASAATTSGTTSAATSGATATAATTTTTGSGDPSGDCEMTCGPNDGTTCSCVRTCAPPAPGFIKVACAPGDDGEIRCVCTLDGNLSSICYEINNAACDFENGCCAKYISGK